MFNQIKTDNKYIRKIEFFINEKEIVLNELETLKDDMLFIFNEPEKAKQIEKVIKLYKECKI